MSFPKWLLDKSRVKFCKFLDKYFILSLICLIFIKLYPRLLLWIFIITCFKLFGSFLMTSPRWFENLTKSMLSKSNFKYFKECSFFKLSYKKYCMWLPKLFLDKSKVKFYKWGSYLIKLPRYFILSIFPPKLMKEKFNFSCFKFFGSYITSFFKCLISYILSLKLFEYKFNFKYFRLLGNYLIMYVN